MFEAPSLFRYFVASAVVLGGLGRQASGAGKAFGERSSGADCRIQNVVLIVSDDLKASVLGCYGDPICRTPNIDALAASGMVFESAYCQGTWCAPSRESFMHSRYVGKSGINMGAHFRSRGFFTARVGKIYHMRVPGDIIAGTDGLDEPTSWTEKYNSPGLEAHTPGQYACLNQNIFTNELAGRQSTRMPHRAYVTVRCNGDGSDQPDYRTASRAIEILGRDHETPFFLAVGLIRPHYPMVAPEAYFEKYPIDAMRLPETRSGDLDDMSGPAIAPSNDAQNGLGKYPRNKRKMWQGYYASVSFVDDQVGRILRQLRRQGLADNTAVVFTSDHGYHLGEHTFWQKADLHEEVTRVPLLIRVPGLNPARSDALVELADLFPTLASLAGIGIPPSVQGCDLTPILQDPKAVVRDAAFTVGRDGHGLRTDRYAFMLYRDGSAELYDMESDPMQFDNLASDPVNSTLIDSWTTRIKHVARKYSVPPVARTSRGVGERRGRMSKSVPPDRTTSERGDKSDGQTRN